MCAEMAEITPVELFYDGTELEDGTVPVEDMVDALVGFSGAYAKVARRYQTPESGHRLRVVGLKKGSAKILVEVIEWTAKNPAAAGVLATVGMGIAGGAYKVIKDIAGVIRGKKALHGESITNNSYTFINSNIILQGVELTKEQLEYLQSGELDPDLDRLTRPLDEGRPASEFALRSGKEELVKVTRDERAYFAQGDSSTTITRDDIWLEGTLNSHSKTSNRGMFYMITGKHIRYHYVGDDIQPLLRAYAHSGVVRALGRVTFDPNLEPISIEVRDIQLPQRTLF